MMERWSYHPGITNDERAIFNEALGDGIHYYQPLAIAHLDNLRYRFLTITIVAPQFPSTIEIIEIYKPRSGSPYVTKIIPVNIDL